MFKQSLMNSLPNYWHKGSKGTYDGDFPVSPKSDEYADVENILLDFSDYEYYIDKVRRVQNVHFYLRFMLRREQMATREAAYTRRMFAVVSYDDLPNALEYNLDGRRLSQEVTLVQNLTEEVPDDCVVLIVNVLYQDAEDLENESHDSGFTSENYIEYVIELE